MQKKYLPVIILFVCINVIVFTFYTFLQLNGFDTRFLLIANVVLFILSLLGFLIQMKGLKSSNTNAFLRSIYTSLLVKMVMVMVAVITYIFISEGKVNKASLFTSMGLYFLYTFVEVTQLMKIARRKPNA